MLHFCIFITSESLSSNTDSRLKKRSLSRNESVSLFRRRTVSKHWRDGRKRRREESAGKQIFEKWQPTGERNQREEPQTPPRDREDSSCGRWNNSSLQTGWRDDCTTARRATPQRRAHMSGGDTLQKHPAAQTRVQLQTSPVRNLTSCRSKRFIRAFLKQVKQSHTPLTHLQA